MDDVVLLYVVGECKVADPEAIPITILTVVVTWAALLAIESACPMS